MQILVTGGKGMVGHALKDLLPTNTWFVGSKDYDLRNKEDTNKLFTDCRPDAVIHLAARVGGIKDNSDFLYDYFLENAQINTNVVDACVNRNISKLVAISSTCVYPAIVPSYPIKEEFLHSGYPEMTNFGYAFAKRMMQAQIDAARKQFGVNWTVIYPSNLYGPHDTFDLQKSHVLPALIIKFHVAKTKNRPFVELFGTGKPLRQLTYVRDLAKQIAKFIETDVHGDFNFANPRNYSIAEIAEAVRSVVGYQGELRYNGNLDGVQRKDVGIEKLTNVFKIEPFTDLNVGLKETYEWFKENHTMETCA